HEATTGLDVMLQRALLPIIEEIACSVEENDCLVLGEILVGECSGVLAGINSELIVSAELLHGGDSIRNRVVTKTGCFGKDEHFVLRHRIAIGLGRVRAGTKGKNHQH